MDRLKVLQTLELNNTLLDLHSNMDRLKATLLTVQKKQLFNLHSNMDRLKVWNISVPLVILIKFTFQYG